MTYPFPTTQIEKKTLLSPIKEKPFSTMTRQRTQISELENSQMNYLSSTNFPSTAKINGPKTYKSIISREDPLLWIYDQWPQFYKETQLIQDKKVIASTKQIFFDSNKQINSWIGSNKCSSH